MPAASVKCLLITLGILALSRMVAAPLTVVHIDPSQTYQTIRGFGASLTESGAVAISTLDPAARDGLMTALFSPENGAGFSFLRQPMGASDFRVADSTYDDVPVGQTDEDLSEFSIARDLAPVPGTPVSIVSLLRSARNLNPGLHLMGSPWSAPGWMKSGTAGNIAPQQGVDQRLYGGTLKSAAAIIPAYADYFVKFVQSYAAEGLPVDSITPQNEPFYNGAFASPAMTLSPARQAELIKAIGVAFATQPVDPGKPFDPVGNPYIASRTRILMLDHNWSDAVSGSSPSSNITTVLDDSVASPFVEGVAFHGYGGNVSAQQIIHDAYAGKATFFTEQSGTVGSNWGNDLMYDVRTLIVGGTRAWASTIAKFNLALDETSGPKIRNVTFDNGGGNLQTVDSGFNNGRGVVTIHSVSGQITYNQEFYALAHAAKFVIPGAVRIASDSDKSVAFRNPDGTFALIAYNDDVAPVDHRFQWSGKQLDTTLPARSVVTFRWSSQLPDPAVSVYLTTADQAHLLEKQGDLSFAGTGSPDYVSWIAAYFPGVSDLEIIGTNKDPDHDGETNLMEFVLGGVPNDAAARSKIHVMTADSDDTGGEKELLVTLAVRIGTPVFGGSPSLTATVDGAIVTVSGSATLTDFTTPVSVVGVVPPETPETLPPGYEYRTFSLVNSNGLPDSEFLRVGVTEVP